MELLDNVDPQSDLSTLVSQVVGEKNMKLVLIRMSSPAVVESLQKGKLKGIPQEMKISRTKFFHGYTSDQKELIVQVSPEKIAIFY